MARYVTATIGAIILFVVVCPLTPTPIAVLDGKAPTAHAPAIAITLTAAIIAPRLDGLLFAAPVERALKIGTGSVLDLTCSRLC